MTVRPELPPAAALTVQMWAIVRQIAELAEPKVSIGVSCIGASKFNRHFTTIYWNERTPVTRCKMEMTREHNYDGDEQLLDKRIEEIAQADIQELIDNQVSEGIAPIAFEFAGIDAWFYWANAAAVLTVVGCISLRQ